MKKALLVGINNYPGTQNDLQGCANDITNMYDVLVKYFGFAPSDVVLLADARATKAAILRGLQKLVGGSNSGDTIVFHYSGHGSQVRDTSGDEQKDGKDEIICPWDFDWDGTYISDDDLASLFADLKKSVHLEVILDSCHSGTGTREIVLDKSRLSDLAGATGCWTDLWASRFCIRPRYLSPPPDVALRADGVFGEDFTLRRIGRMDGIGHVLWAACRPDQYSSDAEIGGRPAGVFTYFFCRHIRDTQGKVSRADLLKRVRASLRYEGFSQVPQLECPDRDRQETVFQ